MNPFPQRRLHQAYWGHRPAAKRRELREWNIIWRASGHLDERGKKREQYCMARHGDQGAYEVGNVKIITMEDNGREASLGIPPEVRKQVGRLVSLKLRGRTFSEEHRCKLSLAAKQPRRAPNGTFA